jgi:hypothetical protein
MKHIIGILFLGVLSVLNLTNCSKKNTIPADAPPSGKPPVEESGIYSGFFVIEKVFRYDTLNNQISPHVFKPWARVFNSPQNDYNITKGVNNGTVSVDYKPLNYQSGVNAFVGNPRSSFDSVGFRFHFGSATNLPTFQNILSQQDTFYLIQPFLLGFIPTQISVNQPFSIPLPNTNGVDEILVYVKKSDGSPLSEIKRFPGGGTTTLTLNPVDFANVSLGYHDIEVAIKRFFPKTIGGKTFRFELHTVVSLTKRFI